MLGRCLIFHHLDCWQVWNRKLRSICPWILDTFQGHNCLPGHRTWGACKHQPPLQRASGPGRSDNPCQPEAVAPSRKDSIEVAEMPWPPQGPFFLSGRNLSKGCRRSVLSPLSASLWQERSTKPGSQLLRCCRCSGKQELSFCLST